MEPRRRRRARCSHRNDQSRPHLDRRGARGAGTKIAIESIAKIVTLNDVVPARIWEGTADAGVVAICYVVRISPRTHDPDALAVFDAELRQTAAPTPEAAAIPLRFIP
jgi:hypothetical protein